MVKMGEKSCLRKITGSTLLFAIADHLGSRSRWTNRNTFTIVSHAPRSRGSKPSTLREREPSSAIAKVNDANSSRSRARLRGRDEEWPCNITAATQQNQAKTQLPKGPSGFVRNPVNTNLICTPTKFDVPDSMEPSEFGFEVSLTRNPMTHP